MEKIRVQKWLSQNGLASRREAEAWIEAGRLSINGKAIVLGDRVDPLADRIYLDGKPLLGREPPRVYWMLHKPDEVLTSRKGQAGRTTIYDLEKLKSLPFLVFPVGRLDYRTEGLLLLTNDGELTHRLSHPRYKLPRTYHVLITGRLTREDEAEVNQGLVLEDGPVRCDLQYAHSHNLGRSKGSWYFITVYEGRNRLVRRVFEKYGHTVAKLIRTGFGKLTLPEGLAPGDYRQLTSQEIRYLKGAVDLLEKKAGRQPSTDEKPD